MLGNNFKIAFQINVLYEFKRVVKVAQQCGIFMCGMLFYIDRSFKLLDLMRILPMIMTE